MAVFNKVYYMNLRREYKRAANEMPNWLALIMYIIIIIMMPVCFIIDLIFGTHLFK